MSEHTPGDLCALGGRLYTSGDPYGRGLMLVAEMRSYGHLVGKCTMPEAQAAATMDANADRLALAWNCLDDLLAACEAEEAVDRHWHECEECDSSEECGCDELCRLVDVARDLRRAAIAKVRRGSDA